MSFEKDGFVAKKISFNTKAPAEAVPNGFTPFDFAVSLFKQYDDINLVVFNQPVGIIHYDSKLGDFDYDTDYTKSIQSQLEAVFVVEESRSRKSQQPRKSVLRGVGSRKDGGQVGSTSKEGCRGPGQGPRKAKRGSTEVGRNARC